MADVTSGFFTREDARRGPIRKSQGISNERLREIGEAGVARMNPRALTKHMLPSGSKSPDLYVLGEAPGEKEDEAGEPFVGPSGRWIRDRLPDDLKVRFNNVCRTMPVLRGNPPTRKPTPHEVECYRTTVEADIEATKPRVILGTGGVPFRWAFGLNDSITGARGRRFPIRVKSHVCWYYPILHPAFVLRASGSRELVKYGDGPGIPGVEIGRTADRDMKRVVADLENIGPPELDEMETLFDGVEIEYEDAYKVRGFLFDCWRDESLVGIDIECNCLRPYEPGAKLLTIAVATKDRALAFPVDHPESRWSKDDRALILAELKKLILTDEVRKTIHNLSFDLEWLVWLYGDKVQFLNGAWECSQRQAYILDERNSCQSLNAQTQMHFGFKIKEQSAVDRANLEHTPLLDVLRYNALDAKYHRKVYLRLRRVLRETGLEDTYLMHVDRAPSLVMMQRTGMPTDQKEVRAFQKDLAGRIDEATQKIMGRKIIAEYEQRFGKFNPNSNDHLIRIFRDMLGRKEGKRGDKYSTDEEALRQMTDVPLAGYVLDLRKVQKLKSTYIDPLDIRSEKTVVYPDERLHPQYKDTGTDSGRLSCEDPNAQNFPIRRNAEIRRIITAVCQAIEEAYGLGPLVLVSADYAQIEYRVIGMTSLDKVVVDSCWTGYDVHEYWAKRIIKVYPDTFMRRHGHIEDPKKRLKAFRSDVKNQDVFPFFYKAGWRSIAGNLEMPEELLRPLYNEKRETFKGVTAWQDRAIKEYDRLGYIQSLSGRRRHGPLSPNMVVNSAVQGDAADLNVNAMNRLRRKAIETGKLWLAPIWQIHDDLGFLVPQQVLLPTIKTIARTMCNVPDKWAKVVPLTAEIKVGPNWFELNAIGAFDSHKLEDQLAELRV